MPEKFNSPYFEDHHLKELSYFLMKKCSILFFLFFFISINLLSAQDTLFDESRVSSVYIDLAPDSLEYIMQNVLSDRYLSARFVYDFGNGKDTLDNIGFRLRGNTSRFSQKKSFKISFNEFTPGQRYKGVKKINLNGQHNDPCMIREKLFYDTWKKAGMVERRCSFVKLYINSIYYGVYTNLEEFDKDWLERVYAENEGNLYKCTYPADLVYINSDPQTYKDIVSGSATAGRAYDLQTNESTDDYTDLIELITALKSPADALFAVNISAIINVDNVLKAFALDVATGNWDDYMYNKNNYFLYHNQGTGKFEFISYDTDNTFGVDWLGKDWATRNCLDWVNHSESRPLATKLLAVPSFNYRYKCFLDTIARSIIVPDSIFPHIDYLKNLIAPYAVEDTFRTLDYGYTMSDFYNGFIQTIDEHTPYGIKPFLTLRQSKILEQNPVYSIPPSQSTLNSTFYIFPNPTSGVITVGGITHEKALQGIITDASGKKLKDFRIEKNESCIQLNISDLPSGVYSLTIQLRNGSVNRRIIKQ